MFANGFPRVSPIFDRVKAADMAGASPYVVVELEKRKTNTLIAVVAVSAVVGVIGGFLIARRVMS
jgi:hypothetical protein